MTSGYVLEDLDEKQHGLVYSTLTKRVRWFGPAWDSAAGSLPTEVDVPFDQCTFTIFADSCFLEKNEEFVDLFVRPFNVPFRIRCHRGAYLRWRQRIDASLEMGL